MEPAAVRSPRRPVYAALGALAGLLLASCSATTGPQMDASAPSFAATQAIAAADIPPTGEPADAGAAGGAQAPGSPSPEIPPNAAATESPLPEQVAFLPAAKPVDASALAALSSVATSPEQGAATATEPAIESSAAAAPDAGLGKKRGLFGLFSSEKAGQSKRPAATSRDDQAPVAARQPKPVVIATASPPAKPLIDFEATGSAPVIKASFSGEALPGVRQSSLFEITRRSGLDDDSDVDLHEEEAPAIQMVSAGSLARLDPRGLLLQRESVDVACLKPRLMATLKQVERHFGKKLVVTSGYRSPSYNRKVRGARNSQHMVCAAADVQMPGVTKWDLAAYVRSMPGRGGVGTYCHTESVHIDIGPERDWNWRCRRRKA